MREPPRWWNWTLRFYVPEGREVPSFEQVDAFLAAVPGLVRYAPYTGMFYTYECRETGVRASFRYDLTTQVAPTEALAEAIPEEDPPAVEGWTPVPLEFIAGLGVSSWWAWESMPLAERACEGLGLSVLDHHLLLDAPRAADAKLLTERWAVANASVVTRLASSPKDRRFYLAPDRLRATWEYLRERERLETELAPRGVRVPEVIFLASGAVAETAIAWQAGQASILPQVDRVLLRRVRKGWFGIGAETESGAVAWEPFRGALGPTLSRRPGEDRWWIYDVPRMPRSVARALLALPLSAVAPHERLDPGAVIDLKPANLENRPSDP